LESHLIPRSVLWSVMSIAASLMILVSVFTDQWLIGPPAPGGEASSMGLFGGQDICVPMDNMLFEGECVPDLARLQEELLREEEVHLPHAWKGGIACLVAGLATMVLTVALSLLTPCLRTCCCCSVFTCCGSLQSFAAVLFTMGLLAYPAGWGSDQVRHSSLILFSFYSFPPHLSPESLKVPDCSPARN